VDSKSVFHLIWLYRCQGLNPSHVTIKAIVKFPYNYIAPTLRGPTRARGMGVIIKVRKLNLMDVQDEVRERERYYICSSQMSVGVQWGKGWENTDVEWRRPS
jgi:hypothetical protein